MLPGVALFVIIDDKYMLILSFVIFCLSLYRAGCIYRTITKGSYETVEGRCTAVMICMMPVAVYPKKYVDDLQVEIGELKEKVRSGKQPTFDSIDALMQKLEEN